MGQVGWIPDWFGNNGRAVIQALFQGPNCVVNTVNYGCYNSPTVNSLISKAEAATDISQAGADWHQADMAIMKDADIVPVMSQQFPMYASSRVRGAGFRTALFAPNIGNPDITNLWLANG
jgi:peptide/nickel transport system substrate-binding protein